MRRSLLAASTKPPTSELADTSGHPGPFIRATILKPRGLSVVDAAKLVGIGRPALNNFLNGRVSTTPKMAARIEAAFGLQASRLLDMQAAFDAATATTAVVGATVTPYSAPFLGIKARDIELWANQNISARSRLAVLLRTLVHSTGRSITNADFPGNDDAERPGWDGELESTEGTPWIPVGKSGWEFGTNKNPKSKAEGDYAKSVKALSKVERSAMTFVFVTPRAWYAGKDWAAAKRTKRDWRDVRVYDASSLEQWIEQSIAAQVWLAHELGRPTQGVRTLSQCWDDWANVAEPPLPGSLFENAIDGARGKLAAKLAEEHGQPVVLMADSTDEALAFLARFFEVVDEPQVAELRERVLVFDEPGTAKRLAQGTAKFVAVVHSRAVERDFAALAKSIKCIVVYPRNAANIEPDLALEPLSYEHFRAPLEAAGYKRDDIARLDHESGRSLTVLRRRLSKTPGVQIPDWASDRRTAASLVPYLFVGAWNATRLADQTVLSLVAGDASYDALERQCQHVTQLFDPPMWSAGHYRGVTSKLDLLFAIAGAVTRPDLERFFTVAQIVLGEDDPKLDLPEDQQWAAAIHGKSREFSGTLRRSIAETLVLLAVHGRHLFFDRLGFDCEVAARRLVRDLLTPLKTRLLEASSSDLTAYAEAAPDEFLSIIEADLRKPKPETYGLMRPAGTGVFSSCPRTGLLWALEGLAWSPSTMPRTALVLAQLSQIEINDNWINRPVNSLEAIFRAWMPQTAAGPDARLKTMNQIVTKFPRVAWKLCIEQLRPGPRHGSYSHKPKWRNDGQGYGEPHPTRVPVLAFMREMVAVVLDWRHGHTAEMINDLVNCLAGLLPEHRDRVWAIIEEWAASAADAEKALVCEHIRRRLLSRHAKRYAKGDDQLILNAAARRARAALEPSDLLQRHEWLFRSHWVEESADDIAEEDHDYQKREERIAALRANALREVYSLRGPAGIVALADLGDANHVIGYLSSERVLERNSVADVIRVALVGESPVGVNARRLLIAGLVNGLIDHLDRQSLLDRLGSELPEADYVRVLLAAPFRSETWQRADVLSEEGRQVYWSKVFPDGFRNADDEAVEAVERLIAVRRPRAAFHSAHFHLTSFDPELLYRLLSAIAKDSDETEGQFQLEQYYIEKAFERVDQGTELSLDQKAGLEYLYIDALSRHHGNGGKYGIPNLTRYVELHPELFVQAMVYSYRRDDGGIDPEEFLVPEEHASQFAKRGYSLLSGIDIVPGRDGQGQLTADGLRAWLRAVRSACQDLGRLEIADLKLGELLSHAPAGDDGVWPCEPVRDVLEEIQSEAMMQGVHTGQFNARGVYTRGEGGAQEREIAERYRAWADALQYTHPYVSSHLLMRLVQTYEHDARREDTTAIVKRRLRY